MIEDLYIPRPQKSDLGENKKEKEKCKPDESWWPWRTLVDYRSMQRNSVKKCKQCWAMLQLNSPRGSRQKQFSPKRKYSPLSQVARVVIGCSPGCGIGLPRAHGIFAAMFARRVFSFEEKNIIHGPEPLLVGGSLLYWPRLRTL